MLKVLEGNSGLWEKDTKCQESVERIDSEWDSKEVLWVNDGQKLHQNTR